VGGISRRTVIQGYPWAKIKRHYRKEKTKAKRARDVLKCLTSKDWIQTSVPHPKERGKGRGRGRWGEGERGRENWNVQFWKKAKEKGRAPVTKCLCLLKFCES
jgi:hypothetical protein